MNILEKKSLTKMSNFQDKIESSVRKFEEILGLSFKVFLATALVVSVLGIYVANLLFGNHSLAVLENLNHETEVLELEIENFKKENAKLHKEYLEWTDAK